MSKPKKLFPEELAMCPKFPSISNVKKESSGLILIDSYTKTKNLELALYQVGGEMKSKPQSGMFALLSPIMHLQ